MCYRFLPVAVRPSFWRGIEQSSPPLQWSSLAIRQGFLLETYDLQALMVEFLTLKWKSDTQGKMRVDEWNSLHRTSPPAGQAMRSDRKCYGVVRESHLSCSTSCHRRLLEYPSQGLVDQVDVKVLMICHLS